tara:strand:+ start:613 stop:930 length:318 start_codon:yes stop_codon:yes gene_type:complete
MSETNKNQSLEFNILGCVVRVKGDDQNNKDATRAVDLLNNQIQSLKQKNPSLKDIDLAVLSALKLATDSFELETEYKENVFALKSGIEDALNFVEEISASDSPSS